jgi:hypothetical protein
VEQYVFLLREFELAFRQAVAAEAFCGPPREQAHCSFAMFEGLVEMKALA